ncbi:hypothetical protein Syun_001636 [Stephania yunnanensis]|uniref:Uncharacterized protein n=1 Tax=Stephania yunnanensis TaxID=152371 RepID=A0AAP0Q2E6_9MAGN
MTTQVVRISNRYNLINSVYNILLSHDILLIKHKAWNCHPTCSIVLVSISR